MNNSMDLLKLALSGSPETSLTPAKKLPKPGRVSGLNPWGKLKGPKGPRSSLSKVAGKWTRLRTTGLSRGIKGHGGGTTPLGAVDLGKSDKPGLIASLWNELKGAFGQAGTDVKARVAGMKGKPGVKERVAAKAEKLKKERAARQAAQKTAGIAELGSTVPLLVRDVPRSERIAKLISVMRRTAAREAAKSPEAFSLVTPRAVQRTASKLPAGSQYGDDIAEIAEKVLSPAEGGKGTGEPFNAYRLWKVLSQAPEKAPPVRVY